MALSKKKQETKEKYDRIQKLKAEGYDKRQVESITGYTNFFVNKYWSMQAEDVVKGNFDKPIYKKIEPIAAELLYINPKITKAALERGIAAKLGLETLGIRRTTLGRFFDELKEKLGFEVNKKTRRTYRRGPNTPGDEAQVDMGQKKITDMYGNKRDIYMFVMVMGYSRMKYAYFQDKPFVASDFIYAHELAFKYFGGVPNVLVYDQDRVMVYGENYGDIIFQSKFKEYKEKVGFQTYVCRGCDPESKGKVERVISHIKIGFLDTKEYRGIDELNSACLEWLDKVANATVHSTTRRIPREMFQVEKELLKKHTPIPIQRGVAQVILSVNSMNEVCYKKNFYSVPYELKKEKDKVRVEERAGVLYIYDPETNELLTAHKVIRGVGGVSVEAKRPDHYLKPKVEKFIQDYPFYREYLEGVMDEVPRYFYDQFLLLLEIKKRYGESKLKNAITLHMRQNIYCVPKILEMLTAADGEDAMKKIVDPRYVKHYKEQAKGYEKYISFINEGIEIEKINKKIKKEESE